MAQDRIEREIFIEAGIERVWSLVAHAGFWVGDAPHFDVIATEGETVAIDAGRHGRFPVLVERLEPPRYAAYRWASGFPGASIATANATRVEFTLVEREGGVLLSVVESGFAGLAGTRAFRAARHRDNVAGWASQLALFRHAAEGVPAP